MSRSFASQGRGLGVNGRALTQTTITLVDSAEDGDIAEYGGDTGGYSTQTSTVYDQSTAIEGTASSGGYNGISSTSGLPAYPAQGDVLSCRVYLDTANGWADNDRMGVMYGTGAETMPPDGYRIDLDAANDDMILAIWNSNGFTSLATANIDVSALTDAWIKLEVDWQSDGTMVFTVYDSSGSSVNSVSATDTTYSSGGVGYIVDESGSDSTPSVYFDYYVYE